MAREDGAGIAYLGWFLFGATLGGLTALLMAPRTGEQNREMLGERGGEFARRAQALAVDAQHVAGEWLERGREALEQQTQRLMGAFEAGRDAMRDEMRKGPPQGG
jgi:gas vesicle protein